MYSKSFQEYILSEDTLKKLQGELFKILLDVKYVAEKYGIKFMLAGGTMLGAVRHKGFIPWDDDIDLFMFREEAMKLVEKIREEFPDKYVVAVPLCDDLYFSKAIKIYKKGTTYIEIPLAGVKAFDMLFIDIFMIENVPANKVIRRLRWKHYKFMCNAASVCIDYKYPSPIIMEKAKENKDVAEYINFRRRIGWFFCHFGGMKYYQRRCEKIANYKRHTGWVGVPTGNYDNETYPENILRETIKTEFCGEMFDIPAAYDVVLGRMFGDYMKIPDPSKREFHVAYKIEF